MGEVDELNEPGQTGGAGSSESRLEEILNSIAEGFFATDRNLMVTFFNTAAEQLLDRRASEVVGHHLLNEVFPEVKGTIFEEKFREAIRLRKPVQFEAHMDAGQCKDWFDVRIAPHEEGLRVLFQVTTEYHRAMDAVRSGQRRFQELFDNIGSGVAIYAAGPDGMSFTFRDMNPAGQKITGRSEQELLGRDVQEVFPGVASLGLLDMMRRVWRTGKAEALPMAVYADSRIPALWVENYAFRLASGEVIVIFNDHTAERRALEEVRSVAQFPEENPDPVLRVNRDGLLTYANSASRELLADWGISVGQIIPERLWQQWREVVNSGRVERVVIACGERTFSLKITPIAGTDYANIYGRDVTDVLAAAQEHERVQEQLRQSQKLESIGRLAGGVAHDLNNLLTPILGYSQLAMKSLAEADPLRKDIEQIFQAGMRAQSLMRQLLAFGRSQTLEMAVVNLTEEVRQFVPVLRRVVREDVEVELRLSENLGNVRADPVQIHQILMNLAVNAQDAMPAGGKLRFETADVKFDETQARTHPDVKPGPYVMLAVSDTGVGMDEELKQNIFEPFFTTKPPGKGTGLGLATVYGIVMQHKGGIWVYSEPGRGSTFKIYLPRVEAEVDGQVAPPPPAVEHHGETILVVEDEKIVRDLACEILRRHGYNVLCAADAEDALALVGRAGQEIHLLVTDVVMPKMNGRELFDKLSRVRPRLAVLYMSGYTDSVIADHGILQRDTSFIQKPFSISGLIEKVRRVLDNAGR